jgi:hypothetical protein
MKNLLIYINPLSKKFLPEHEILTEIQIDNSLRLGWNTSDIMLVTNFDYEYKGVKSIKVNDYTVFDQDRSTKIPAINELFERGLIHEGEIYWFHDHDAFQLIPFGLNLKKDAGFTDHGAFSTTWNAGSFFFKKSAKNLFADIWKYMNERGTNEQNALTYMWQNNINGINERYEKMNITYNIGIYKIPENIQNAELPIKVAHFHPHKAHHLKLYLDEHLLPQELINIFKSHGITV